MKSLKIIIGIGFAAAAIVLLFGCNAMSKTAQKVSDDFGDGAQTGHALVSVIKLTPSDPASNSSPSGKVVTIIGDLKSIPMTSKNGTLVKDYFEFRETESSAWYSSSIVTKEKVITVTGDNAKELSAYHKKYLLSQAEAEARIAKAKADKAEAEAREAKAKADKAEAESREVKADKAEAEVREVKFGIDKSSDPVLPLSKAVLTVVYPHEYTFMNQ